MCILEEDYERDDAWLQSLAAEFNVSETCFVSPITGHDGRFRLRWFTPSLEVWQHLTSFIFRLIEYIMLFGLLNVLKEK